MHICEPCVCLVLLEAKEDIGYPGTGVTDSCKTRWVWWSSLVCNLSTWEANLCELEASQGYTVPFIYMKDISTIAKIFKVF